MFLSYAHEDAEVRDRLQATLRPVVRDGRLEVWDDTSIGTGRRWSADIADALARAEVAVLLVSTDFLASEYIMGTELPHLVERDVPLVCVPVGHCLWQEIDPLERVQWPLPPSRPLRAMGRNERDAALVAVYRAIAQVLHARGSDERPAGIVAAPRAATPIAKGAEGPLLGVPVLPPTYQPRHADLDALKTQLATEASVGLVGRQHQVGLHGVGGVGKSVLAAAACHDPEVRSWFPEGVAWVTLGEGADQVAAQARVARAFGAELVATRATAGLDELRRLLEGRHCLLVVDDVWSAAAAQALGVTGPEGRVLYTTRDASVLAAVGAVSRPVDALDRAAAVAFLRAAGPAVGPDDEETLQRAAARTGGVVLALSLIAAVARADPGWANVEASLGALGHVFGTHPYADVFKAMRVATDALTPADASRYRMLGVFGEDVWVPDATVGRLWGIADPGPSLARLADAGLLGRERGRVRLHDLQRAFVLFDATGPMAMLHGELLGAHRPAGGWGYLPHDEPYLWDHLVYHLVRAGEGQELARLAGDGRWLVRRLRRDGPYAAEADMVAATAALPADASVRRALVVLRRWGTLFRGLSLPAAAATFVSRVPEAAGAAELAGDMWLQPHPGWPLPEPQALVRVLEGHIGAVRALAISANGATVVSAGDDRTVRLWDAATGAARATLTGHTRTVLAVAISADGATVVSGGSDNTARLWDAATGALRATLEGHTDWVRAVGISSDGATVISAGEDGTVRLWNGGTGMARATLEGHTDRVRAVAISGDGATIASAGSDGSVRLWNADTNAARATLAGHTRAVSAVAISGDGAAVISAGEDGTVWLWDTATGAARASLKGHTNAVWAVAVSADGATVASAGEDRTVRLWDGSTAAMRASLEGHTKAVLAVAISADGAMAVSGGEDGTTRVWDPATAAAGGRLAVHVSAVSAVAISDNGATMVFARDDGTVRLWDAATGTLRATLEGHTGAVSAVAISADGTMVASVGDDRSVRLWDAVTGTPRAILAVHANAVSAVAISADGATIIFGGEDHTVRLWDAATGSPRATLNGHTNVVRAVAISADGATVASGGDDRTVRLWDAATGVPRATLKGHLDWVRAVAISADGARVASAGSDGTVRLWDAATGAVSSATLARTSDRVSTVAISADGAVVASAGSDHTLWLLSAADDLPPQGLVKWLRRRLNVDRGSELRAITSLTLVERVHAVSWAQGADLLAVGFGTEATLFRVRRR